MIPYLARDGKLPGWRPSRTGRWLLNRILAQLARVDQIVYVSEATKRDLLAYVDLPEDRVHVIHNAVFQPMAPASPDACANLRRRLGLAAEAPLVLHVGRDFYKNRPAVLEVFAHVRKKQPAAILVLVGALEPALRARAVRLGIVEALHVLDFVPREEMAALYSAATVLLFPSLYEGFGLPVLEARLCGTPIVCSDAGALTEAATDQTVTIAADDIRALSEAVLSALCARRRLPPFLHHVGAWVRRHQTLYDLMAENPNDRTS